MNQLDAMTADFVGRISVAVWIGRLTDDAARAALDAYALARRRAEPAGDPRLCSALLAEYRHRREGQELCS